MRNSLDYARGMASVLVLLSACSEPEERSPDSIREALRTERNELSTVVTTIASENEDRFDFEVEPVRDTWITPVLEERLTDGFVNIQQWSGANEQTMADRLTEIQRQYAFVFQRQEGEWLGEDIPSGFVFEGNLVIRANSEVNLPVSLLMHEWLHAYYFDVNQADYDGKYSSMPLQEGADQLISNYVGYPSKNFDTYRHEALLAAALGPKFYQSLITDPDYFNKALQFNPPSRERLDLVEEFAKRWKIQSVEDKKELHKIFVEGELFYGRDMDLFMSDMDLLTSGPEYGYAYPSGQLKHLKALLEKNGIAWADFVRVICEPLGVEAPAQWLDLEMEEDFSEITRQD